MTRRRNQLRGRLQRQHLLHWRAIEGQVPARTDPDLEHAAFRRADHPLAIGPKLSVAHREIANPRKDNVVVEAHGSFPSDATCHFSSRAATTVTKSTPAFLPCPSHQRHHP